MRAPRRRAHSSSSSTITPDPSPMMNPSRFLSKGRLARAGSSLRVESARIAANPPPPMGVMAASRPPPTLVLAVERGEAPDARRDVDANPVAALGRDRQPGGVHGELRCGDGELDEDVRLLDV